jgi:hypothetical protein
VGGAEPGALVSGQFARNNWWKITSVRIFGPYENLDIHMDLLIGQAGVIEYMQRAGAAAHLSLKTMKGRMRMEQEKSKLLDGLPVQPELRAGVAAACDCSGAKSCVVNCHFMEMDRGDDFKDCVATHCA